MVCSNFLAVTNNQPNSKIQCGAILHCIYVCLFICLRCIFLKFSENWQVERDAREDSVGDLQPPAEERGPQQISTF